MTEPTQGPEPPKSQEELVAEIRRAAQEYMAEEGIQHPPMDAPEDGAPREEAEEATKGTSTVTAQGGEVPPSGPSTEEMFDQLFGEEGERGQHNLDTFERLARLGHSTRSFEVEGNKITLRSLTQREELEGLERIGSYGLPAQTRAYSTWLAAQSMMHLNHKPWHRMPVSDKDEDAVRDERFQRIQEFHPGLLNRIILEYQHLRDQVDAQGVFAKKE